MFEKDMAKLERKKEMAKLEADIRCLPELLFSLGYSVMRV